MNASRGRQLAGIAAALALTVAACGRGGTGPDDDGSPIAAGEGDPSGLRVELIGWSTAPYPDDADVAVGFGGLDYVALHVQACLDVAAQISPEHIRTITVGDAQGVPFNGGHWQGASVVSPARFDPPGPGECTEGWVYPAFEPGLEPVTAVWLDVTKAYGGDRWWPLGEPYPTGPLPVFGDVLELGDAWEVVDGASWAVHGVRVAGPDDPVPPGDLDADMAWVVVDAVYCEGRSPGTIHEALGVVVDGWAVRGRARTVEQAIEPTASDGCHHRPVAVRGPQGMSVTAVTGTDHGPPWWPIDPPVAITR